jgi:hypothetical protein
MSRAVAIKSSDTVIHVNRGTIDKNRVRGEDSPPLTMRRGKYGKGQYGDRILILDRNGEIAGEVVYNRDGILACGAKAVIIAHHGARVDEPPVDLASDC